jgi:hypothetical protein
MTPNIPSLSPGLSIAASALSQKMHISSHSGELEANPITPVPENVSRCEGSNLTLKFINIAGEPSRAIKDDTIRNLIRRNARSSTQRGRRAPLDKPRPQCPLTKPGPAPADGLQTPLVGRTRFALSSRKPMKRVRRRNVSADPAEQSENGDCQVIPRIFPLMDFSSDWLPPKTKPNIGKMLQHRKQ